MNSKNQDILEQTPSSNGRFKRFSAQPVKKQQCDGNKRFLFVPNTWYWYNY